MIEKKLLKKVLTLVLCTSVFGAGAAALPQLIHESVITAEAASLIVFHIHHLFNLIFII